MNFATHIGWLTVMWGISSSVLLYYDRVFDGVIGMGRYRWERTLLLGISHLVVFFWWLTSVFEQHDPGIILSTYSSQVLFVVFQNGTDFAKYWISGPNKIYEIRVWYTNIFHIVLDGAILFMPVVWIWRAQHATLGKLVYMLLFLSGASSVSPSLRVSLTFLAPKESSC